MNKRRREQRQNAWEFASDSDSQQCCRTSKRMMTAAPPPSLLPHDEWAKLVMESNIMSRLHVLHDEGEKTKREMTYFWCGLKEDVAPITHLINANKKRLRFGVSRDVTLNTLNWTPEKNADAVTAAARGRDIRMGFYSAVRLVFISRCAWHKEKAFKSAEELRNLMIGSNGKDPRITYQELMLAMTVAKKKKLTWKLLKCDLGKAEPRQYAYLYTLFGYPERHRQQQCCMLPLTTPNGVSTKSRYQEKHGARKLNL